MKTLLRFAMTASFLVFGAFLQSGAQQSMGISFASAEAKTFTISNKIATNEIKFQLDAPIETIKGKATDFKGTITLNPQQIETLRGTITVSVPSMNTGVSLRDNHMLNSDWLDAAQFPTITFTIEKCIDILVKQSDAASGRAVLEGKAVGTFTLHGVTKPLTTSFSLTYTKATSSAPENIAIRTQFPVAWKEFGIKGKKGLANLTVGETVVISANVSGQ